MNKPPFEEDNSQPFASLRKKARQRLHQPLPAPEQITHEEALQLYSELQIYHEELEIQNEELRHLAQKLEKAQANFYNLFHFNPLPIVIIDLNARILQCNLAFNHLIGHPIKKILNQPLQKFILVEDQPLFISHLRALTKHPEEVQLEVRIRDFSDQIRLVRLKADLIEWQLIDTSETEDTSKRLMVALIDITHEKKAEEILLKDRRRLQILFEMLRTTLLDEGEIIPITLNYAIELTHSRAAFWFEVDPQPQGSVMSLRAASCLEDDQTRPLDLHLILDEREDYNPFWHALRNKQSIQSNRTRIQLIDPSSGFEMDIQRLLTLPVLKNGHPTGVLALANKNEPYDGADSLQVRVLLDLTQHILAKQALEKEIRRQQEQFRDFIESSNDILYRIQLKPTPKVDFISPSCTHITGYTPEEIVNNPQLMVELVHPEDRHLLDQLLQNPESLPSPLIGRFVDRNGETHWGEQKITPIYDSENHLVGIQGVIRDVTQRVRYEEQIERILSEYEILFNNSQETFFLIKVDEDGQFRYLRNNRSHQVLTGFSVEDLRGKTPIELLGPELGRQIAANYQRCVDAGEPISYEETLDLPAGRRTWFTTLTPVFFNNKLEYIIGSAQDITELRQYQQKSQESEARYENLFSQIHEGFCIWRILRNAAGVAYDFSIEEINPAGIHLIGQPLFKVKNLRLSEIPWKIEPDIQEFFIKIAGDGLPIRAEIYIHELKQYWQISLQMLGKDYIAETFLDITQRKRIELERERMFKELQAKNHELENFTYTVSHDLKSPLITIRTFADFIQESLNEGKINEALDDLKRVQDSATKMQSMLDGLLELSRIGRKLNLLSSVNIGEVIQEALENLSGKIENFDRAIRFEIINDFPEVMGDHLRLVQVFQNLIDNAIKYMGDQPNPEIQIGWENHLKEVWFYVRDNGIGIEPQNLTRVFDLYAKLDTSSPGYGIGLSVVQRIIEMHGGRVWAESEGIGKGTTFWFSLPLMASNL